MNDCVVYRDERYVFGAKDGSAYLIADGERFRLSCHPFEPCLYITDEGGRLTAVHNAFDPLAVLNAFYEGQTVVSITGRRYDAKAFCRMARYAAGAGDLQIDDAERVFGKRAKAAETAPLFAARRKPEPMAERAPAVPVDYLDADPFYSVAAAYPDNVVDYCLVKGAFAESSPTAHRQALAAACCRLFAGDDGWRYDIAAAEEQVIDAEALFAPAAENGALNYRKAVLFPPCPNGYTDADFETLNSALFPNGTAQLEAYTWTTDWSDYFDEGREWWGTLCCTVFDKSLGRFAVILASATD